MRSEPAAADAERRQAHLLLSLLVGACGLLAALALPFAPVIADRVSLTWPTPGEPVASSTAVLAPYRPSSLTAEVPCAALRPSGSAEVTVLATGPGGAGLVVKSAPGGATVQYNGQTRFASTPPGEADCRVVIKSGNRGLTITDGEGATTLVAGPVPEVFGFRTDLPPALASGISVTAELTSPFGTSPTTVKQVLIAVQLLAAAASLLLLHGGPRRRRRPWKPRLWWIDAGMIAVFAGWAVIGPLAVDDGWAATIARNFAATGEAGNYYRWWNAPEAPFELSQQLLSPFTEVSLAPLWLRLPSTLLGIATWLVLSRGVLGAAIPAVAGTVRVRLLAAVLLLAAWLPFNLGVRPESYVAFGATAALALIWRARAPRAVGWAVLAAALTVPISPTGMLAAAPLLAFAPRIVRNAPRRALPLAANVVSMICIGAVCITAVFADQTLVSIVTATDWHTFFGPSFAWYDEPDRYEYLLGSDQQGNAVRRLPILLTAAMLPTVVLLAWHRRPRTVDEKSALRLAAVVVLSVMVFAGVPSKWSYHLGAAAGIVASFLTVAVVLMVRRVQPSARRVVVAVACAVVLCAAIALAFAGPNMWWLGAVYDVPQYAGPIRPKGVPLNNPLLWVGVAVAGGGLYAMLTRTRIPAVVTAPAVLTATAAVASVALLLGSLIVAPIRRPTGSLALANVHSLTGSRTCGLADDIEVLPDGPDQPWIGLNQFLAASGPVLIGWPSPFVFPCVHNIAKVADGAAQTPGVIVESPRPQAKEDRDPSIGGTFAALARFGGDYREVPSRLVGHPDLDWGTVLVAPAGQRRDAYQLSVTHETRWGFDATGRARAER